ncbi:OmpA family protein [Streptomyces sp. NPDC002926]
MRATAPHRLKAHVRPAATSLAAAVLLVGCQLATANGASADDDPSIPPGSESTYTPPKIDSDNPGLKMRDGATLADSRVLDIVSIVESEGGEERREETNSNLKFALQAEVLFSKDSANLSPQANGRIAAIVAEIKKHNAKRIRVFGFTDNLGTYEHGQVLSKKRAGAVHGVLAQQLADAGITYEVRGYSEDYPIADNATEEGRTKNRRVEVSFPTGGSS